MPYGLVQKKGKFCHIIDNYYICNRFEGAEVPSFYLPDATLHDMIAKETVEAIAREYLEKTPLTLVRVKVSKDNDIDVTITRQDAGVTIDDCVELSRHIESKLDRDREDFSLTVGSARRSRIGGDEDEDEE